VKVVAAAAAVAALNAAAGGVVPYLTRQRWRVVNPVTSEYERQNAPVPPAAFSFQHGMKGYVQLLVRGDLTLQACLGIVCILCLTGWTTLTELRV
jgi:hypothetical protein